MSSVKTINNVACNVDTCIDNLNDIIKDKQQDMTFERDDELKQSCHYLGLALDILMDIANALEKGVKENEISRQ